MHSLEDSTKNKLFIDLVGALISGSFLAYEVLWHSSDKDLHYGDLVKYVLLAVGSYAAAAVLLYRFKQGKFIRKIPSWILIAILGSMILVIYMCVFAIYLYVFHPLEWQYKAHPTLIGRMLAEIIGAIPGFFILSVAYSLLTLPIMAVVYYAGSLIRWVRR